MAQGSTQIAQHIDKLAQFLLINQLCNQQNNTPKSFNYNYISTSKNQNNQKPQHLTFTISHHLNPFFMTQSKQSNQQSQLKQCMLNSQQTENVSILLKNVIELPKLRYQQSQKLFQKQNSNYQNQEKKITPKKLSFQTAQKTQNVSKVVINLQETQISQNFLNEQLSIGKFTPKHEETNFVKGKKVVNFNDSQLEKEKDIEFNMSVRSQRSNSHFTSKKQRQIFQYQTSSGYGMIKKKNELQQHTIHHTQSQKKAKQEKSFIQTYFQSAKNQILQNCSLNCCQGMLWKQDSNLNKKTMKQITPIKLTEVKNSNTKPY